MKIREISTLNLNETYFKFNPNSITAKGENNKTKAIINDIQLVRSLPMRKKTDINIKLNGKLNTILSDELYTDMDKNLYCFIDNSYHELICKMALEGCKDEFNKLQEKIKTLTEHKVNILFVNFN